MGAEEEEDDDVIDVDNPEDLAKKGLRRIQIEGDEQEYLLENLDWRRCSQGQVHPVPASS